MLALYGKRRRLAARITLVVTILGSYVALTTPVEVTSEFRPLDLKMWVILLFAGIPFVWTPLVIAAGERPKKLEAIGLVVMFFMATFPIFDQTYPSRQPGPLTIISWWLVYLLLLVDLIYLLSTESENDEGRALINAIFPAPKK